MLRRTLEMRHMYRYPVDGELRNSQIRECSASAARDPHAVSVSKARRRTYSTRTRANPGHPAPAGTRWVDARSPRERVGERWCVTRVCAEFHCATLISVPVNQTTTRQRQITYMRARQKRERAAHFMRGSTGS